MKSIRRNNRRKDPKREFVVALRKLVRTAVDGKDLSGYGLVMVLNDGETYTGLSGCKIMAVPADALSSGRCDELVKYGGESEADTIKACESVPKQVVKFD